MSRLIGRFALAMITNIISDSVLKFHQLSTPLATVAKNNEKELLILKNNPENFSKISLASYEVSQLPRGLSSIQTTVNNFSNCDCSYLTVYSFYNDALLKSGNYAYDNSGKELVKYSELLEKNNCDFSISFFVSISNALYCYDEYGFIKATLSIGQAIERLTQVCINNSIDFNIEYKNANTTSNELQIDVTKQLYIATVNIRLGNG